MLDLNYRKPDYPAVQPLNSVLVCRGVPFTDAYEHSINFADASMQYAYFTGKLKYEDTALSPITLSKPLRLPHPADDLFDCNYLVLRNMTFTSKILYAFIDRVEYVNPSSCYVYFSLDLIQTFLFDWNLGQCLVEREHVASDKIGEHILDEGFQLTEYTVQNEQRAEINSEIGIKLTWKSGTPQGELKDNIYNGLMISIFEADSIGALNDMIASLYETPDNIVAIQMIPYKFYNEGTTSKRLNFTYDTSGMDNLNGYVPKNNKLFVYPYNFLYVDNAQGQGKSYQFENWKNRQPYFTIYGSVLSGADITVVCTPGGLYNGWNEGMDISESITLSGYPLCPWVSDTYKAYMAQENIRHAGALGSLTAGALLTMAASPAGLAVAAASAGSSVISEGIRHITTAQKAQLMPEKTHGNEGSNTLWSYGVMDFYFAQRCVKADLAETIDGYFNLWGYRVDKVKTPQYTSRKSWNYVKTRNAVVNGNIPFDARKRLEGIFNKGITFWHGDYVGSYGRDNSIA